LIDYSSLIANYDDGIIIAQENGNIIALNSAVERILSVSKQQLQHLRDFDQLKIHYFQSRIKLQELVSQVNKTRSILKFPFYFDYITPSSEKTNLEIRIEYHHNPEQSTGIYVIPISDVTSKVKYQIENNNRNNIKSLGSFAVRIANNYNNYLSAINGHLALIKMVQDSPEERNQLLTSIENIIERMKNATLQLFEVAKDGLSSKEILDMKKIPNMIAEKLSLSSQIVFKSAISDNLWRIEFDHENFSKILGLMIDHFKDSVINGGTIEIRGENFEITKPSKIPLKPSTYVKLSLSDSGPIISRNLISRLFEPFIYTSQTDQSGMRLYTVYSTLISNGGFIEFDSANTDHNTFHLYFPAIQNKPSIVAEKPTIESPCLKTQARILVLDDEELICATLRSILQRLGHHVEIAQNSKVFLEKYSNAIASSTPFDLVIMDLILSESATGIDILGAVQKIDKNVRAIISTGDSSHPVNTKYQEYGFVGVLSKPYGRSDLERVISEALLKHKNC
jgi:nitrogen-specific signal transduction histidine kinase/ActR/RegA family two-component response regulator